MRRYSLLSFVLISVLALPLPTIHAQKQNGGATATTRAIAPAARRAAEKITAAQLKDYLYYVASDEMEGRDTPSPGLDATAKFISTKLAGWGVKPGGDNGTYFQNITLRRDKVDSAQTHAEIGGRTFNYGNDFLVSPRAGTASGPLVYVGHGWVIKAKNINPYEGVDVRDKILIISGGLPKGITPGDLSGKKGVDWEEPAGYAQAHGAKGIVVIPRARDFDRWQARRNILERGSLQVEKFQQQQGEEAQVPAISPSAAMIGVLFEGEQHSGQEMLKRANDGEPGEAFALSPNKQISFTVNVTSEKANTQNVIGILEGKDSALKKEYVAIGAHYDHVGKGLPVNGDAIYNGADDDGSGTVAVLAIAEALARGSRPKRSVLFIWHCAEEKGLWGSRYFTEYPTVPLNQIITQLNIDMIGRSKQAGDTKPANRELSGPNEIYVIGSKMMSTELGELSERTNKAYLNLDFNYRYDDPSDPNRFFFRSDHFNYAQKGIPIIFYFDGVHEDYHKPSDTPDKIDYAKMEKVTRTIFMTTWELANLASRPRVDKQLPSELTER